MEGRDKIRVKVFAFMPEVFKLEVAKALSLGRRFFRDPERRREKNIDFLKSMTTTKPFFNCSITKCLRIQLFVKTILKIHKHVAVNSTFQKEKCGPAVVRCAVSKINPNFDQLCEAQKAHPSHKL